MGRDPFIRLRLHHCSCACTSCVPTPSDGPEIEEIPQKLLKPPAAGPSRIEYDKLKFSHQESQDCVKMLQKEVKTLRENLEKSIDERQKISQELTVVRSSLREYEQSHGVLKSIDILIAERKSALSALEQHQKSLEGFRQKILSSIQEEMSDLEFAQSKTERVKEQLRQLDVEIKERLKVKHYQYTTRYGIMYDLVEGDYVSADPLVQPAKETQTESIATKSSLVQTDEMVIEKDQRHKSCQTERSSEPQVAQEKVYEKKVQSNQESECTVCCFAWFCSSKKSSRVEPQHLNNSKSEAKKKDTKSDDKKKGDTKSETKKPTGDRSKPTPGPPKVDTVPIRKKTPPPRIITPPKPPATPPIIIIPGPGPSPDPPEEIKVIPPIIVDPPKPDTIDPIVVPDDDPIIEPSSSEESLSDDTDYSEVESVSTQSRHGKPSKAFAPLKHKKRVPRDRDPKILRRKLNDAQLTRYELEATVADLKNQLSGITHAPTPLSPAVLQTVMGINKNLSTEVSKVSAQSDALEYELGSAQHRIQQLERGMHKPESTANELEMEAQELHQQVTQLKRTYNQYVDLVRDEQSVKYMYLLTPEIEKSCGKPVAKSKK